MLQEADKQLRLAKAKVEKSDASQKLEQSIEALVALAAAAALAARTTQQP